MASRAMRGGELSKFLWAGETPVPLYSLSDFARSLEKDFLVCFLSLFGRGACKIAVATRLKVFSASGPPLYCVASTF